MHPSLQLPCSQLPLNPDPEVIKEVPPPFFQHLLTSSHSIRHYGRRWWAGQGIDVAWPLTQGSISLDFGFPKPDCT